MKKYLIWILLILMVLSSALGYGQEVKGRIVTTNRQGVEEGVPYAKISWRNSDEKALSDTAGYFEILNKNFPDTLVISSVGYETMAFEVKGPGDNFKIDLDASTMLDGVVVYAQDVGKYINLIDPINVETIGSGELRKAACCNLSESFETNASVDVNLTDAVSGAKKLQMLGLDGIYTQLQWENIPLVRGLSTSYGLAFTPGTWIESIQITKGTGSVVNGYETMAGLINLKLKQPCESEKLYVNIYGNRFSRMDFNMHGSQKLSDKWATMTFIHVANQFVETDVNNDGFKDQPVGILMAGLNRWEYEGDNFETRFGIKGTYASKIGGEVDYAKGDLSTSPVWGASFETLHAEAFLKTGIFLKKRKTGSFGLIHQAKYHDMTNVFGPTTYKGTQKKYYFNGIYSDIFGNTNHTYKTGASFIVDDYRQSYNDSIFLKTEIVPGAFFEYTFNALDKVILVAGLRGDYHNMFGPMVAPRLHFKWNMNKKSALRLSTGRGFRVPNPFADYNGLMASNRTWYVDPNIIPEEAISSGVTFVQKFLIGDHISSISVDYFYTFFRDQLITDMDVSPQELWVYNTAGQSYSHSLQVETNLTLARGFDFRTAFKFYDVRAEFGGQLRQKPFVPKFRVLLNSAYTTRNKKWSFDVTANWVGVKRLPHMHANPPEFQRPHNSVDYWLLNSQVTYNFKYFSVYLGGENLLNVIQQDAIISADDPFGPYFDATQIWAPIYGFNIYAGLHFSIEHKKK